MQQQPVVATASGPGIDVNLFKKEVWDNLNSSGILTHYVGIPKKEIINIIDEATNSNEKHLVSGTVPIPQLVNVVKNITLTKLKDYNGPRANANDTNQIVGNLKVKEINNEYQSRLDQYNTQTEVLDNEIETAHVDDPIDPEVMKRMLEERQKQYDTIDINEPTTTPADNLSHIGDDDSDNNITYSQLSSNIGNDFDTGSKASMLLEPTSNDLMISKTIEQLSSKFDIVNNRLIEIDNKLNTIVPILQNDISNIDNKMSSNIKQIMETLLLICKQNKQLLSSS